MVRRRRNGFMDGLVGGDDYGGRVKGAVWTGSIRASKA